MFLFTDEHTDVEAFELIEFDFFNILRSDPTKLPMNRSYLLFAVDAMVTVEKLEERPWKRQSLLEGGSRVPL